MNSISSSEAASSAAVCITVTGRLTTISTLVLLKSDCPSSLEINSNEEPNSSPISPPEVATLVDLGVSDKVPDLPSTTSEPPGPPVWHHFGPSDASVNASFWEFEGHTLGNWLKGV